MTNDFEYELAISRKYMKLPFNRKLEQNILTAMLIDENARFFALNLIPKYKAFFINSHKIIFKTISDLCNDSRINFYEFSIIDYLEEKRLLGILGDKEYFKNLHIKNLHNKIDNWCNILLDYYLTREFIYTNTSIIEQLSRYKTNIFPALSEKFQDSLFHLKSCSNFSVPAKINDYIIETLRHLEDLIPDSENEIGLKTGIDDIDCIILGLRKGEMISIIGDSASGKTDFVLNIVSDISIKDNRSVLYFCPDLNPDYLTKQLLYINTFLNDHQFLNLEKNSKDFRVIWDKIVDFVPLLKDKNISFDNIEILSINDLRLKIIHLANKEKIDLIVIDYLQMLQIIPDKHNKRNKFSEIAYKIKVLSKEIQIPIILLVESYPGFHQELIPIKANSDIVMLIDSNQSSAVSVEKNIVKKKITVEKNNYGRTGCIELFFMPESGIYLNKKDLKNQ